MNSPPVPASPRIIPRAEHDISRARISPNALKVLYRLKDAGYEAYLVGGGVRDLLLGREPKDFDIATSARPEELQTLFRNCRLIGRRFRLAHVRFGREIIEVATFRAPHDIAEDEGDAALSEEGRILRDNVYGTFEQDAWRRDFTINALYYDIRDFSVVDHTGGVGDIREGVLRLIGDPEVRYREDPVRMLRAVRFAAKLGFRIEAASEAPLFELAPLLADVAPARLFDEVLKLFQGGAAVQSFELLRHYGLFGVLFPATEAALAREVDGFPLTFLLRALENTDRRVNEGKPVTPAFLFAALLWEPVRLRVRDLANDELGELPALQIAAAEVASEQTRRISLPKRFSLPMREIWTQQPRFSQRQGKRPMRLMAHPRFRAAYDFLCLRAQVGEIDAELCEWWTRLQETDEAGQQQLLESAGRPEGARRKRRRRSRARKAKPSDA
ncbi:polynucleotide adenylyltransferase PcnB [Acidihalobacter prosperus]|uniref:Poly(A) polymerase I n=1 Tax=Acidihalobacter prosperus TaxID=160660 RepID=A0A1A6C5P6_9GAMM|nr:polynucleotide adenylyltransferase PcnB [Acidihalobacter prosperus]OBS09883.1 polynucleotide adenylyltransferase PcnB [Acidihalobacter prosperus]